MEAGRELDALVAERVMGGRTLMHNGFSINVLTGESAPEYLDATPRYSTSIADAWSVVEAMRAKGLALCLEEHDPNYPHAWTAVKPIKTGNVKLEALELVEVSCRAPANVGAFLNTEAGQSIVRAGTGGAVLARLLHFSRVGGPDGATRTHLRPLSFCCR